MALEEDPAEARIAAWLTTNRPRLMELGWSRPAVDALTFVLHDQVLALTEELRGERAGLWRDLATFLQWYPVRITWPRPRVHSAVRWRLVQAVATRPNRVRLALLAGTVSAESMPEPGGGVTGEANVQRLVDLSDAAAVVLVRLVATLRTRVPRNVDLADGYLSDHCGLRFSTRELLVLIGRDPTDDEVRELLSELEGFGLRFHLSEDPHHEPREDAVAARIVEGTGSLDATFTSEAIDVYLRGTGARREDPTPWVLHYFDTDGWSKGSGHAYRFENRLHYSAGVDIGILHDVIPGTAFVEPSEDWPEYEPDLNGWG